MMEWLNGGMVEWWNGGMMECWNVGMLEILETFGFLALFHYSIIPIVSEAN
jgi:hypothetical protein